MRLLPVALAAIALAGLLALVFVDRIDDFDEVATPAATTTTATEPERGPLVDPADATTTTTAAPAPKRVVKPRPNVDHIWDRIADCESGEWDANGDPIPGSARWDDQRNGYEGGLHWLPSTWDDARTLSGLDVPTRAWQATREQQIAVAEVWLAATSWDQWPKCSTKVGAR